MSSAGGDSKEEIQARQAREFEDGPWKYEDAAAENVEKVLNVLERTHDIVYVFRQDTRAQSVFHILARRHEVRMVTRSPAVPGC